MNILSTINSNRMPTVLLSAHQIDDDQKLWRACIPGKSVVVGVHGCLGFRPTLFSPLPAVPDFFHIFATHLFAFERRAWPPQQRLVQVVEVHVKDRGPLGFRTLNALLSRWRTWLSMRKYA
jgi:hypothetical protein